MGERRKPPSRLGTHQSEATKRRIGESVSAKLTGKSRQEFSQLHRDHLSEANSRRWERDKEKRREEIRKGVTAWWQRRREQRARDQQAANNQEAANDQTNQEI